MTTRPNLSKGIAAGVLGGLIGSAVLKGFIVAARACREGVFTTQLDQTGPSHQVANLAVQKVTGEPLSPESLVLGGEIVHYAFGAIVGGIYGALAEYAEWTTAGTGLLFGTGVFLAADETSMPALGLTNKPWQETPAAQLEHYLAHLAFGVSTELARKAIRASGPRT